MKKICAVLTMLLAATAFGCKEAAAPKSEVRVESRQKRREMTAGR